MMKLLVFSLCLPVAIAGLLTADDEVVFRSDVSLVRVDAQVIDRDNRAIMGLRQEDFLLREEGRNQPISNFASEEMPVDVMFLLDVSGSMRPHVQRIANAAHDAMRVLGKQDRVGIMVFDTNTRVRLALRSDRGDVDREFENLLKHERFNGGTDITRGIVDAANYLRESGRRDARRAVVILTDDQTQAGGRDEERCSRALTRADAVLSALIAPDAMQGRGMGGGNYPGGGYPGGGRQRRGGYPGGSTWPGSGGGGGPLGGIILGPTGRMPGGGGRGPGGGMGGHRTESAGTSEIARQSGGDSLQVDDASALETTLSRIRQRYALHFHLPEGVKPGQERNIEVLLANSARQRYPDAEVRFRRVYVAPGGSYDSEPTTVTRTPSRRSSDEDSDLRNERPSAAPSADRSSGSSNNSSDSDAPRQRRRAAISEPEGPKGANPAVGASPNSTPDTTDAAPVTPAPASDTESKPQGGFRRLKPGEKP